MAKCDDCGFRPVNELVVPDGAYALCYDCASEHMCQTPSRKNLKINGDPYSPDGVIWYAPDMMRHADGRPFSFIEPFDDYSRRRNLPEIRVQISDPQGLLGPDHPTEIVIGGAKAN